MALTHEQARELVQKSLQTRLDDFERASLDAHLAGCPRCAAYRVEMGAFDRRLSESLVERWPEPRYTPAQLNSRLALLHTKMRRNSMFQSLSAVGRLAGAAAMLVLIVLGLGLLVRNTTRQPIPGGGATPTVERATPTTAPAATASPAEIPTQQPAVDRLSVKDAEKLVRDYIYANNSQMNPDAIFPLQEITPDAVWNRLGGQVFKVTDGVQMNEDYYVRGGQVYKLGTAFGGNGITQMVVADLDGNGSAEMLYTFSFGSGLAQRGLGLLVNDGTDVKVFEPSELHFLGGLDLEKRAENQVVVVQSPEGSPAVELGEVRFINQQVVIVPTGADLATFTDAALGITFQYPSSWKQEADGRYLGEDGAFFMIQPVFYPTRDLIRACEWMAYQDGPAKGADNPPPYGSSPSLGLSSGGANGGADTFCLIRSTMTGRGYESGIVFTAPDGRLMLLRVSAEHADIIAKTLRFTQSQPTLAPVPVDMTPAAAPVTGQVETRALGELTLGEFAVVSASVDTPGHFEFKDRIPAGVFPKQAEAFNNSLESNMARNNQLLEPFGYRLEKSGDTMRLFQFEKLLWDNISTIYPVSISPDGRDLAMLMTRNTTPEQTLLVRPNGVAVDREMIHQNAQPIFAGNRLITLQTEMNQMNGALAIQADGKEVMRYNTFFGPKDPVRGLTAWDGKWVLEVDGTLIVEGENLNLREGYAEAFNARTIGGKPFYFFEKDGKVGISYGGQALPIQYDAVVHDQCCEPAAFNIQNAPDALWFYAKRDGMWYWVEIRR